MILRASGMVVWQLTWWPLVTPPLHLLWALDGSNWLSTLLILLTSSGTVLLTGRSPGKRSGAYHGLSFAFAGRGHADGGHRQSVDAQGPPPGWPPTSC